MNRQNNNTIYGLKSYGSTTTTTSTTTTVVTSSKAAANANAAAMQQKDESSSVAMILSIHSNQRIPFRYTVTERKGESLTDIAVKCHTDVSTLCRLNPMILDPNINFRRTKGSSKMMNISKDNDHPTKKILFQGQSLVIDDVGSVTLPPTPNRIDHGWGLTHVVTGADASLQAIALAYNTTESAIRSANRDLFPIGVPSRIYPRQLLHILRVNNSTTMSRSGMQQPEDGNTVVHCVESHDTFESIGEKYHLNMKQIISANPLHFPIGSRLQLVEGMDLMIKSCSSSTSQRGHPISKRNIAEVVLTKQIHEVLQGDTPERLCEHYDMTMDELRQFNRSYFPKGYRGHIRSGMKIVVKRRLIIPENDDSNDAHI